MNVVVSWAKTLIALVLLVLLLGSYSHELGQMEASDRQASQTDQPVSKTHDAQSNRSFSVMRWMFGWSAAIV